MAENIENVQIKKKRFKFKKRDMVFVIIGIVLAFAARFLLVDSHTVHHHANFALYINGEREKFENFTFYEEVASCSTEDHGNPRSRVHMHGNVNNLVHVHDAGATWSHFFANLGYTLGDTIIVTDTGIYKDGENENKLTFILNGQKVSTIANKTIESEDRLLIDYGSSSESEIANRAEQVPSDAREYNSRPDPSSCSGGSNESFMDRFKRTLGIGHAEAAMENTEHSH